MYTSKYYTVEEIDERLKQGYLNDATEQGFVGTMKEFWALFLSIANKVDKKEGYGLSQEDFTTELKDKLNSLSGEIPTKVSQLENDLKFQTKEEVEKYISDLIDGADGALDTLKELADALNNDPNFATNLTNKLIEIRDALTAEVNRAKAAEAEAAGADFVGAEELVQKIQGENWFEFDIVVATPDMMGVVGRLGRVLGPKGLMPNPKSGTVTFDVTKAVEEIKAGKVEYRLDKSNIIHVAIGKVSFGGEKLAENFNVLMNAIIKAKPSAAKGQYLRSISVTSTMGPGVKINPARVSE